jgi:hypothetical protein
MTTQPHPTIPHRAVPIIVRTHPPIRARRAAASSDGPTVPVIGLPNYAPNPTSSGAEYIARLDRIMLIS